MPPVKIRDDGRVQRMITLAYLLSTRSEIHIEELQERLNVDRNTIESDLNILMFCGLPPYSPEQLFDIIIEDDFVSMLYNDVFVKPLRLNKREVTHAVVALERLLSIEPENREPIEETLKLINSGNSPVVIESENDAVIKDVICAIESKHSLDIEYLSLNSASITKRTIDPIKIFTTASLSYIFGYCHNARSIRIFRTDRIISTIVNDQKSTAFDTEDPDEKSIEDNNPYVFIENKENHVDFKIDKSFSSILDTYPHEVIDEDNNIYRFYSSSPFFAARMLLSHSPEVTYVSGSITVETILKAVKTIVDRMND